MVQNASFFHVIRLLSIRTVLYRQSLRCIRSLCQSRKSYPSLLSQRDRYLAGRGDWACFISDVLFYWEQWSACHCNKTTLFIIFYFFFSFFFLLPFFFSSTFSSGQYVCVCVRVFVCFFFFFLHP